LTTVSAALIRIVIAEEYAIFRHGLRRLLETRPGLEIIGESGTGEDAARLVRELAPDILLLGLTGSSAFPLETLERMAADAMPVRTILLTGTVDAPDVMSAAIQLGACGVVPKDSTPEVLFNSIESVMGGHYWLGRECGVNTEAGVRHFDTARRRLKAFGLTRRELDILRSVVSGFTNKAIAGRLAISENTVKRHLTHIFNKVGASNRLELALFAAHHRLVDR